MKFVTAGIFLCLIAHAVESNDADSATPYTDNKLVPSVFEKEPTKDQITVIRSINNEFVYPGKKYNLTVLSNSPVQVYITDNKNRGKNYTLTFFDAGVAPVENSNKPQLLSFNWIIANIPEKGPIEKGDTIKEYTPPDTVGARYIIVISTGNSGYRGKEAWNKIIKKLGNKFSLKEFEKSTGEEVLSSNFVIAESDD